MRLKFRGEDIEVIYDEYGQYIAPTRENPAEYPDVHITEVVYKDVDIMPILGEVDMDSIYELLIDKIYA
jgi:hypothetical protein